MKIPTKDRKPCTACGEPILFARETGRVHAGQPAIVTIDPEPVATGKWVVDVHRDKHYYAGKVKSNQAAGMRAAGVELHTAHNDTCSKKDEFIRKRQQKSVRR